MQQQRLKIVEDALQAALDAAKSAKCGYASALAVLSSKPRRGREFAEPLLVDFDDVCELEKELADALDHYEILREAFLDNERNLELNFRARKHWRVIATRMALGELDLDSLTTVCFHELIGQIPTEAALDAQLQELTTKLEERERHVAEFGALRVINLTKEAPCDSPSPSVQSVAN